MTFWRLSNERETNTKIPETSSEQQASMPSIGRIRLHRIGHRHPQPQRGNWEPSLIEVNCGHNLSLLLLFRAWLSSNTCACLAAIIWKARKGTYRSRTGYSYRVLASTATWPQKVRGSSNTTITPPNHVSVDLVVCLHASNLERHRRQIHHTCIIVLCIPDFPQTL